MPDGTSVVVKACDVTIVDRSFFHPRFPVICQFGMVTDAMRDLELLQINNQQLDNGKETQAKIQRASEICLGDLVVSSWGQSQWLGQVAELSLPRRLRVIPR